MDITVKCHTDIMETLNILSKYMYHNNDETLISETVRRVVSSMINKHETSLFDAPALCIALIRVVDTDENLSRNKKSAFRRNIVPAIYTHLRKVLTDIETEVNSMEEAYKAKCLPVVKCHEMTAEEIAVTPVKEHDPYGRPLE